MSRRRRCLAGPLPSPFPPKGSRPLANGEAILRQNPAELEFHFLSGTPRRSNLAERASFPLLRAEVSLAPGCSRGRTTVGTGRACPVNGPLVPTAVARSSGRWWCLRITTAAPGGLILSISEFMGFFRRPARPSYELVYVPDAFRARSANFRSRNLNRTGQDNHDVAWNCPASPW